MRTTERLLLLASVATLLRQGGASSPLSFILDLKDRIFSPDSQATDLDQENLKNNSYADVQFNGTEYDISTLHNDPVQGTESDIELQVNVTDIDTVPDKNEQEVLDGISAPLNVSDKEYSDYEYNKEQEFNYTSHQEINGEHAQHYNFSNVSNGFSEMANEETNTTLLSSISTDLFSLTTITNTTQSNDSSATENVQITTNVSSTEQYQQLDKKTGNERFDSFRANSVNEIITGTEREKSYANNMMDISAKNASELFFLNATNFDANENVSDQEKLDESSYNNTSIELQLQISNETKENIASSSSNRVDKNRIIPNKESVPVKESQLTKQTTKIKTNLPNLVNVLNNSTQIVERFIENITDSLATLNPEIETLLSTANVEGITKDLIESNFTNLSTRIINKSNTIQSAGNQSQVNADKNVTLALGNVSSEFNDRNKRSLNLTFSWDEENTENSVIDVSSASTNLNSNENLTLAEQLNATDSNEATNKKDCACRANYDDKGNLRQKTEG